MLFKILLFINARAPTWYVVQLRSFILFTKKDKLQNDIYKDAS